MENIALIGLSRLTAFRRELDVIANNLANLNTTGFKADDVVFQEYLMPVARDDSFQRGGDRTMSFVWDRATVANMSQGGMDKTDNPMDVALGARGFFTVQTPQGERYTRNGSFEINPQGQLVTKQGYPVLGEGGPITFEQTDVSITINRDGTVATNGGNRGRLRIVDPNSPRGLEKSGENLFRLRDGAAVQPVAQPNARQGYVERSNVSPVQELSRMIEVNRAYASLVSTLDRHDQIRRDAIRSLGETNR